jgi:hypothetical protein
MQTECRECLSLQHLEEIEACVKGMVRNGSGPWEIFVQIDLLMERLWAVGTGEWRDFIHGVKAIATASNQVNGAGVGSDVSDGNPLPEFHRRTAYEPRVLLARHFEQEF